MAKFIEDRSSLKKKKKKETTAKKVAAPSSANKKQVSNVANQVVNRTANAAKRTTNTVGNSAQRQNTVRRNVQTAVSRNAPQRYNNRPSGSAQPSTNHTVQDRLAASRQRREQAEADIKRRRQESEARSQRISQSRNPRMQDTQRGVKMQTEEERRQRQDRLRQAQEQKMGNNSMASKEAQRTANRAVRNTPTVAKESAKQVAIGHGKTFADVTEANQSAAIGSKIDIKSKEFQEDIEKRRKESTRVAKSSFKTLSDMQEKSEAKMEKVTKDAKGLEKAYYGALESGVGMATDRLAGPAWAVSMLSRTYGNTRGQAKKEGATEDEDRAYSLLQAAKEVATEYMFQGVGLAKGLSGRHSLSLGEMAANAITKNMRGPLANATHAGIRLLGGVGEENAEEAIGWGLDPFIKEFTYGRNVRTRQAQQMMREQSDALRSNITSMDDARAIAAYLGSDDFLDSQIRTYMDSGIGKEEARDLAENMRDYLDASLSGDTEKMADIEESLSKKLSGRGVKDILKQDLSLSELKDTIASTTLLTATTGLPGTVTTTARGAAIKEQLGSDGIRALAKTAEDFEDGEMQLKAKAMSERLDAGKDITNTQAYDLAVGVTEQYNKDADRQQTAYQTAQKTIKSEKLVTPYRVSRDGDIQMDEVTDKTYQSTAKSAKSAIETFIENSDGKESLTDTEIDRGSRAIAGFKTGVFTVDDANELNFRNTAVRSAFEKETGVDLGEYVVKGKDGQIDIPATNTATKNALFAQAADNLVATAQAETANWVDNTKGEVVTQISRRMGASGTAALQTALDDVDERDRSSYMMTANASDVLYQSARNMGTEWENAKDYAKRMFPNVAEDKLKAMYEAGLADRDMATDEARGQQIKIGEKVELKKQSDVPTGQVIIETSAPVKGSVIRTFTELARNLGVDIHLVDHFTDKNGKVLKNVNGEYIDGNIFINVNSDFEKNMGFIFMHEVTHHLKLYAPEQYKALENLVREKWFKYDSAQMQSAIAKKIETYAKHGQTLTEEQALEEIIADAAHEFLTDRNFAREVANEDATLAQAVLTSIRNALRMLRRIMSADGLDETHMNTLFSQLDILDEAERLWLDAYKQAVRNNAAVEVDRLQNQIYEEGRMSVGYHAGDLGKSTVDDYAHQGYGRGTGHFGFGTYFVGDEEQINYGDYGKRKHETVDFDKYNLFRPTNFDKGLRLHDALKLVDGFITEYSEFNQYDRLSDEGIQNSLDNTVRINRAAETLVDDYEWEDYQWNDNSLRNKEKVDKYIAEKLDEYDRSEIESKARQRYDEEQNKKIDEESIRKELAHHYDTFKGMKDFWGDPFVSETSEEEYIQNNLEDTIRIRTENKNIPYDYYYYKEAQEAIKGETERWEWKDRRLKNLASDLQSALGFRFSEERIAEALKETERIVRGYKHDPNYSRLDVEPGLDSGATVFMKQLGYEGVDVRHISEMDNTGYGSVIYDLKDEDLARKNEIGTARFSVSDSDYMDAVNRGDMETAQRMVDEAAKDAGYVESVYHGTSEYFNVFNLGSEGIHLGNEDQATQVAKSRYEIRSAETRYTWGEIKDRIAEMDTDARQSLLEYLENNDWKLGGYKGDISDDGAIKEYADKVLQNYVGTLHDPDEASVRMKTFDRKVGERILHLYAKLNNPFVIENDLLYWTPSYIADVLLMRADGETNMEKRFNIDGADMDISGSEISLDDMGRMDLQRISGGLVKGDQAWALLEEVLHWNGGYDGIKYLNKYEGDKNSYSYIALQPSDVKSADPVTYDDNGDVIPLSERFNQSSPDIRYSIADTDSEGNAITEQEATVLHDIGPDVRFSMTTENEPQAKAAFRAGKGEFRGFKNEASGRELRTKLIKENFPEGQADAIVKAIDSFMDATGEFLTDKDGLRMKYQFIGWNDLESGTVSVRRDKNGKIRSVNFSAMKKNDEYPVNFDFSTVCNKRISFTKVIEEIAKAHDAETGASVFSEIKLTPDNMWKINEALKAEGIDTACLGCFVESRRYHIDTFFQNVEDRWNKPVREARRKLGLPEEDYFNFSKEEVPGEQWSAADDNWGDYGRAKAFKGAPLARTQVLMNEIVKAGDVDSPLLKLIRPSDLLTPEGFEGFRKLSNAKIDMVGQIKSMYGAGVPKEILGFTPYNSEIALLPKNYKKTKMEKYLKSIGGIRIQSFSDFMIEHVYDHFQLIADAAYRKLPIHAYTKVIAYAKIFGLTGAKINMSVMFDVKNSKQWAEDLGISEENAKKYADKYQGLRFVTETPADYKTAYENASTDEELKKKYDKYISEGATEEEARRKTADWAVRPFRPITLEGKKGYLTYLVSDADYVNEQYQRMYDQYISEGMSEEEAERKANSNKPFEQSINYREAKALQDQDGYRENVGIIGVAFGDEHLRMMMDDENVRYIIPYHSSNLPVVVSNKTNLKVARDYSDRQNTYKAESWTINGEAYSDLKSAYAEFKRSHKDEAHPARAFFADAFSKNLDAKFGDKVEGSNTGAFDVYKSLDDASEISDVSERYLEDCIENNYIPVFHEFADSPGYYKMLFDFMVADDNGSLYPQHEVRNNYPGVDVDAKAEAGEAVTDSDLTELKKAIEEGAKAQNDKLQKWQDRKGNVMQDLLSREGEHSIISDSNINSVRYGTEDYTNPKTGEGIPKDAKLSISEDLDEPYMAAVNAGNMEEAQKYVDEAAERAGMRVAHRYHGSMNANFTVFSKAHAKVGGNSGAGFYFSTSRDDSADHYTDSEGADNYFKIQSFADYLMEYESEWNGREIDSDETAMEIAREELNKNPGMFDVYLNYKRPYVRDYKNSTNLYDELMEDFDESDIDRNDYDDEDDYYDDLLIRKEEYLVSAIDKAVYGAISDLESNYELLDDIDANELISKIIEFTVDEESLTWDTIQNAIFMSNTEVTVTNDNWFESADATPELTRAIIENLGFDAIEDKEVSSKFGQLSREMQTDTEHVIVFKPEQIKLSDPVTYAEDGSVIPLSERFDPNNDDIRYSMSTEDADGNVLTTNQMEYFRNSQARDENGRLQAMYHGTENAGFTIFDSDYGYSSNFFFFVDSNDRAKGYSGTHDIFNAKHYESIDEANEYIKSWGNDDQVIQDGDDFIVLEDGAEILRNPSLSDLMMEYDEYSGFGGTAANYKVYLNVENPLVVNADGNSWDEIPYGGDVVTTNWLAEYAYGEGYDGLIVDNVLDYGIYSSSRERLPQRDIVVFSSKQIKDTRNENPTENPDIRYSFTEDEIKSGVDYDHATDMSYEELLMYEDMIANASESYDIESAFGKAFDGEKVSKFYSALTEEVSMVFDDEYLEEGRMRMAKSKADFWSNLNTKWQERWETKGEVLDTKSVKTNVRNLIRGVMNNSNTDRQYKTELVNKTLMDMRVAYQLMKQDRTDIASALLYHSALRMITDVDFIQDDTEYQEYKGIRDYLRGEPITVSDDYWQGKAFQQFRKEHFGILKLRKGANGNIGEVYAQLENLYPHIFSETERSKNGFKDDEEDLLQYIGFVTEQNMQPFMEAYSSEYCADWAFEIADDLYEIMENGEGVTSLADRYKAKYDAKAKAMKTRHAEAILRVRKQKQAAIDALKEHYNERLDRQKELAKDAIRKEREKFRQQNQAAKKKAKERTLRKQMFESIKGDYDWLTKAVLDPTKTKYIPEAFRASLANLLMQMDLETARSKQLEEKYGRVTNKTLKLRELRDRLNDMAAAKAGDDTNLFDIDQYLPYLMNSLAEKYDGQPISALDVDSLSTLKLLFKALRKNFQNLNRESEESKAAIAAEKASRIVEESLQKISRDGEAKTYEGLKGGMSTINMTALTPVYFFERMGTVNDIYKDLRGGFDTYIRNEADIMNKIKGIVGGYYKKRNIRKNRPTPGSELASWRDSRSAKKIKLTHGTVTMTVAQRMSLLCLANREQARKHMIKGGIVITPYETASKIEAFKEGRKGKNQWGDKVIFSADDFKADIDTIKASLTPEQIKVAQQLQQLMAVDMAKLGNEAHREMYGYEIFGDPDYFPIKSKDTWIAKDVNNMTDAVEKIKSFGPAKPLDVNASNAIVVDDIFSVVADHCNGMNLYNAYLVPISNFMRVYNSTPTLENGTRKPVRDALEEAYGKKAMQYIDNFIRDLNGIKNNNRGGLEDLMNKAIGATKATAVAGNLRVAAQQPTAIVRAAAEMQWKYLAPFVKVKPQRGAMKEMFKYCPIAQWKSWGFYDTYMGRDIEDVMMNNWSKMDVALSGIYGTLDNLTWTAIWQGVKAEQHDLHPEMDIKSDEFLKMCGERASEIFDKTQVVDSTFHRSDAMRNKQVAVKLFTAFMSEPTLTLNVFRSALYDFGELKKAGKTAEANKRLSKALTVLVAQAALVSVAQALVDAWRGKEPGFPWSGDDDDEDKETTYWVRFLQNLSRNFIDQLHLENNMYLVKDVKPYADFMMSKMTGFISEKLEQDGHEFASDAIDLVRAMLGWDQEYLYNQNNLVFASLENTANGTAQLFKKLEKGDEYDKEWYDILQKLASGISPLLGIPAGTLMRDFKPIWNKVFSSVFAADEEASSSSGVGSTSTNEKSSAVNLWTYDNAPFRIDNGSPADNFLNFFGINLTKSEIAAAEAKQAEKEHERNVKKIKNSLSKYSGAEYDEKLWNKSELGGYGKALSEGDFARAEEIERLFIDCGGSRDFLDEKKVYHYTKNYAKTIVYDPTDEQIEQQAEMKEFLLSHGVTQTELSAKVYKSQTAKEAKVAFRLNDEDAIVEELTPLIRAGLTLEDCHKLYDNRNRIDLMKYKNSGGKYSDRLKSTGTYKWPSNGTITSTFGHRSSPGGIGSTNHQGIDIGASMGAPVTASDGGVVIKAGWYGGYGKTVQIQHDDGTITQYSHLSWWEPHVGDVVAQGQEVGKVGSTGNSTGPHLHFGVLKNGNYVDPMDYLNKKS